MPSPGAWIHEILDENITVNFMAITTVLAVGAIVWRFRAMVQTDKYQLMGRCVFALLGSLGVTGFLYYFGKVLAPADGVGDPCKGLSPKELAGVLVILVVITGLSSLFSLVQAFSQAKPAVQTLTLSPPPSEPPESTPPPMNA